MRTDLHDEGDQGLAEVQLVDLNQRKGIKAKQIHLCMMTAFSEFAILLKTLNKYFTVLPSKLFCLPNLQTPQLVCYKWTFAKNKSISFAN